MCDITSNTRTASRPTGYISTSDLSFLLPAEKILPFKNGLEAERSFHMLFTERNCFHFKVSVLVTISCKSAVVQKKQGIHLSLSFADGPTEVKIEVLMMGEFPQWKIGK